MTVQASSTGWVIFDPSEGVPSGAIVPGFPDDVEATQVSIQFASTDVLTVFTYEAYKNGIVALMFYRRSINDPKFQFVNSDILTSYDHFISKYAETSGSKIAVYMTQRELGEPIQVDGVDNIPNAVDPIGTSEALDVIEKLDPKKTVKVILTVKGGLYDIVPVIYRENGETNEWEYYSNPSALDENNRSLYKQEYRDYIVNDIKNGAFYYYLPLPVFASPSDPGKITDASSEEEYKEHSHDECGVEWSVSSAATETTNGVMIVKCAGCGAVLYEVPISPMTVWSSNTTTKIQAAKPGSTVVIDAHDFKSIHRSVLDAFRQNPTINIQINWVDENNTAQTITIPAGSADKLNDLFNLDRVNVDQDGNGMFCGFKAMVGQF